MSGTMPVPSGHAAEALPPGGLGQREIRALLPQAPPFLFVDRVTEITDTGAVGIKCVTCNEPFLQGHFPPDEPVLPGVVLIEACSQVGGVFLSRRLQGKGRGYLAKVDNFKFLSFVHPGDTVVMTAVFVRAFGSFAQMDVQAAVGARAVCRGTIHYYFGERG
jgi:3-hydroxymyristoyl/3-hydroxydecanoyl-(acyl carrier protein) dehydratase